MKVCHFEKQMCANYIFKKNLFLKVHRHVHVCTVCSGLHVILKDLLEYALSIQYGA